MTTPRSAGVYRCLLRIYPRSFRDEYGPDMVLLLADQLRHEPAARVWARVAVDLAVTAPARHLEVRMNRPPESSIPVLFAVVSVAGALFALIGGAAVGMAAVGLVVAVVAGAVAVLAWRRARPVATPSLTASWWKFLAGGAAVVVGLAVVTTITGDLASPAWALAMIILFSALVSLAAGLVLGLAHLTGHRHRAAGSVP